MLAELLKAAWLQRNVKHQVKRSISSCGYETLATSQHEHEVDRDQDMKTLHVLLVWWSGSNVNMGRQRGHEE